MFVQDDFSCLSWGAILELFFRAGSKLLPGQTIVSVSDFRYSPLLLEQGDNVRFKVRTASVQENLIVELLCHFENETEFVASAQLNVTDDAAYPLKKASQQQVNNQFNIRETSEDFHLPIDTLNQVFPHVLGTFSPVVEISEITFHSEFEFNSQIQALLSSNEITLMQREQQPLLTISNWVA